MTLASFTCENPDFAVRSVPDGVVFRVQRSALHNSDVFRNMFLCCEQPDAPDNHPPTDEILDLHESVQVLSALLHLLHYSLEPPVELESTTLPSVSDGADEGAGTPTSSREQFLPKIPSYDPATVIPLPVLQPMLFDLVDKYALNLDIFRILCSHLLAQAVVHPLRVYGFAASFEPRHRSRRPRPEALPRSSAEDELEANIEKEMEKQMQKIASKASEFLEPIGSYSMEEVLDAIPNVKALHRVVQLQHFRVKMLREVLNDSEIFPKGYGACPSHREKAMEYWDRQRKALAGKIDSGTDVAGEMELFVDTLKECKICHKAGVAAVGMLAYKCYTLPRKVHHLVGLV